MSSVSFDSPLEGFKGGELRRLSVSRLFIYIFFGGVTFGFLFLLSYWMDWIFYQIYVSENKVSSAGYILFTTNEGERRLVTLQRRRCKINPYGKPRFHLYFSLEGRVYYYSFGRGVFKSALRKLEKFIESRGPPLSGLTGEEASDVREFYGSNRLKASFAHGVFVFLSLVFFGPNSFQLAVAFGLFALGRGIYGLILCVYVALTIWISTLEKLKSQDRLKSKLGYEGKIKVIRRVGINGRKEFDLEGEKDTKEGMKFGGRKGVEEESMEESKFGKESEFTIEELETNDLVPGDVVEIERDWKVPCDIILIRGSCLANEGIFTGDGTAQLKTAINGRKPLSSRQTLFSGTTVSFTREDKVRGVVVATGWATRKGQMMSHFVHQPQKLPAFQRDFFLLLGAMFAYNLIMICIVIFFELHSPQPSMRNIGLKALDFSRHAFPPSLFFITISAIQLSVRALSKKDIKVFTSFQLPEAGAVKLICFDKTGTLTESSLSFHGFSAFEAGQFEAAFSNIEQLIGSPSFDILLEGVSCCHGLNSIDGVPRGDPLEEELFRFSGSALTLETSNRKAVLRVSFSQRFSGLKSMPSGPVELIFIEEFSEERRIMSVVTKRVDDGSMRLFVKGASETIKSMLNSESLPPDFNQTLKELSTQGLKVLTLAYREITQREFEKICSDGLETAEKELQLVGLMLFKNSVRPSSAPCIRKLKENLIHTAIVTGDNIYTAINVAYEVGILASQQKVLVASQETSNPVTWQLFDPTTLASPVSQGFLFASLEKSNFRVTQIDPNPESIVRMCLSQGVALAFDAQAFALTCESLSSEQVDLILPYVSIFSRASTSQKETIMLRLKEYYSQQRCGVAFVGDGANDYLALNAANVGLSLGSAESSFSSAFFSTRHEISPIIDILVEGKACLCNSLTNFRFIMTCNHIGIFAVSLLNYFGLDFTQSDYVIKFLFALPISFMLSTTKSVSDLNFFPMKPTVLFKSFLVPFFVLLYCSFGFIFLLICFLRASPYYKQLSSVLENPNEKGASAVDTRFFVENKIIIFFVHSLYLVNGYNSYFGSPFKSSFFSNPHVYIFFGLIIFVISQNIFSPFIWPESQLASIIRTLRVPSIRNDQLIEFLIFVFSSITFLVLLEKSLKTFFLTSRTERILDEDAKRKPKLPSIETEPVMQIS